MRTRTGRVRTAPIFIRSAQERSPLHDVKQHAHERHSRSCENMLRLDEQKRSALRARIRHRRAASHSRRRTQSASHAVGVALPTTVWWSQTGSNRRPPACKAGALPTELWPPQGSDISHRSSENIAVRALSDYRHQQLIRTRLQIADASMPDLELVGLGRLELPTSRLSSARSNQLSYKPGPGVSNQPPAIRKGL